MRLTERRETSARRATSALECLAFNRISTSCLFSIPNILLPPPIRFTDRGHRESSSLSGYRRACQNFRNEECQLFRNRQFGSRPHNLRAVRIPQLTEQCRCPVIPNFENEGLRRQQ